MSLDHNTTIELTYQPGTEYRFRAEVVDNGRFQLTYVELHNRNLDRDINFGSLEEMEDVAKLMLKAVETARSLK